MKPNMTSIIVGLSRTKAFFETFSWLIRFVTWSPVSHAYIKYYDSYTSRWVIFQASGLKVNMVGQTLFDANEIIYREYVIPVSDATRLSVIQGATDKLGSPYGVGQIVGFGLVLLMRLFGKSINNPFYSGSSYFCSELVDDILDEIGVGDTNPSTMSPTDIMNFLASKGFKTTD